MSSTSSLKVAVMGAGAVGCFFGGMLARAGHAVTLIARPQHVEAIHANGLRMETRTFDEQVGLDATSDPAGVAGADVVLFSVKSMDTESAGEQIRPHLQPGALVLCLQNGVDNAARLRKVLPQHQVAASVVYVGTEMAGPGHLKHHGRGELEIEPSPAAERLAGALRAAGVVVDLSPNVVGALWLKLILNCAYNAISAIAQMPYGKSVLSPGIREVMDDAVAECLAVARAEGVVVPGEVGEVVRKLAESMPAQYSSTAQDLKRGKASEIDYLNGYVDRRGEVLGIPTPVNRTLWALVKLLEGKS